MKAGNYWMNVCVNIVCTGPDVILGTFQCTYPSPELPVGHLHMEVFLDSTLSKLKKNNNLFACQIYVILRTHENTLYMITVDPLHKSQNAPVPCPTMHHFVTEMRTFLLQNGALWDVCLMHCGIFEMGLLYSKRPSPSGCAPLGPPYVIGFLIMSLYTSW